MKLIRALILATPILISACDGYELVRTESMFPYGNKRTAGSGYAYVLAKMMPEKEMKLVPTAPKPKAIVHKEPEKIEKIFNEKVSK
ncbi:MAG: hypothetical protein KTR28_04670 [Micavibrio sp.]|nr:hypothetical protein [Micavibrio sp.]